MADKKISQLTGATTPLAGTEVLPIVQGGTTVKVSIDNVTKGRTVNATTFDTDVAAAGVTLTGTTLSADGTDSNIDVNVTPKGTGSVNLTKVNIDGGTIDGTIIGGASAAAATVTTLNASGSVSLNGAVTINDSAANADFRVESVNNLNMIFSDASADMVGIGTGTPSSRLHVFATNGWDSTEPVARIENLDQSTSQSAVMQLIGGWDGNPFLLKATQYGTPNKDRFVLNATGDIKTYPGSGFHTVINEDGADSDFRVESDNNANCLFVDAGQDRVGINTASPADDLDVFGSVRIRDKYELKWGGTSMSLYGSSTDNQFRVYTNNTERMRVDSGGNVVVNNAAIATNATDGFLYVPTCAGQPTGTPTAYTGRAPIVIDSTNNKLYFYSNGAWRDAGP